MQVGWEKSENANRVLVYLAPNSILFLLKYEKHDIDYVLRLPVLFIRITMKYEKIYLNSLVLSRFCRLSEQLLKLTPSSGIAKILANKDQLHLYQLHLMLL